MITIICALKLLNCHLVFRNCIIDIYRFLQSVEGSLIVLYSFKLEIDMCDQKPIELGTNLIRVNYDWPLISLGEIFSTKNPSFDF